MRGAQTAAEPVVAPPPGNPRFPLFEGLRAIAALSVLTLHGLVVTDGFHGWEGAYARQLAGGVTMFFVISGFLLYRPFVAARLRQAPAIGLGAYARRRVLRILPAYWLALTVLALWPGLPGNVLSGGAWRYYLFAQDYSRSTLFSGLGTAWSLGTEIVFYAVLPVYAALLARKRAASLRALVLTDLGVLAGLSVAAYGFRAAVAAAHPELGYTLLGTFDWFALGMALAVLSAARAHAPQQLPRLVRALETHSAAWWIASFGCVTMAAAYWQRTRDYDAYSGGPLHLLWGLAAVCAVAPAAFGTGERARRSLLAIRPLAWLGVVSYGIYLWHLPLVPEVDRALAHVGLARSGVLTSASVVVASAVVAVACAATSYYAVERRALAYKDGFRRAAPGAIRHRLPDAAPVPGVGGR